MKSPLRHNRWAWVGAGCLTLVTCAQRPDRGGHNLLAGVRAVRVHAVANADRITDGIESQAGDNWLTEQSAVFSSDEASITYDLGAVVPLVAVYLQGDNNDTFFIEGSADDRTYTLLWTAAAVDGAGMRSREIRADMPPTRYVRLRCRGGDPRISVAELQVFSSAPAVWPPLVQVQSHPVPAPLLSLLAWAALTCLALLGHRRGWPALVTWVLWAAPVGAGILAAVDLADSLPMPDDLRNQLRIIIATVAAAAVVRLVFLPRRAQRRPIAVVLVFSAFLSLFSFYGLGYPQFWNAARNGPMFVHDWDMRIYFPTAKYFAELGYDGVYLASLAAYIEDVEPEPAELAGLDVRDLNSYELVKITDHFAEIEASKSRFTPERWRDFKGDMAWFRHAMGRDYLNSLTDHGANAAPAWMAIAHLLFCYLPANEIVLTLTGAIDLVMLIVFFFVAARAFGVWSAAMCIVIWGTTALPFHGTCWAGATLRHDWMIYLGLGVCALRRERWMTGGALLGAAAMMRAFPALAVLFLAVPSAWRVGEGWWRTRRLPRLQPLLAAERPFVRAAVGVVACVLGLSVLSTVVLGADQSQWVEKISRHAEKPAANAVGLRNVMGFDFETTASKLVSPRPGDWWAQWADAQRQTLQRRRWLHRALIALLTMLALLACRPVRLHQAALVGMLLVPIWFNPANYYLHYVFLLPLLTDFSIRRAARWRWGIVALVPLAMSCVEYAGLETSGVDIKFTVWSLGVIVGFGLLLLMMAVWAWRDRRWPHQPAAQQLHAADA